MGEKALEVPETPTYLEQRVMGLSPVRVLFGKGILADPGKAILDGNQKNG
jgi:hypothetical protein